MGTLATFLTGVVTSFIAWLTQRVGARVGIAAAFIASYLVVLTALYVALKAAIMGLILTIDNHYLIMGFWLVWPENAEAVVSAVVTTDITIFIYRTQMVHLKSLLNAG